MVFKNFDMALDLVIKCSNDIDNGILSYLSSMPLSVLNIINKMISVSNLEMEYRGTYIGIDNKKYRYCFRMLSDSFTGVLGIDLNLSRMRDTESYEDMHLILYPLVKDKYYYNHGFAMYKKNELHKLGEKSNYSVNYYTINKNNEGMIVEDDYLDCCNNKLNSGYLYYNFDSFNVSDELYIDDINNKKLVKER